jgi:Replication-relaxation
MPRVFARTPRCYRTLMGELRRSRMERTSTGRRIALSPRDIELFKLLSRYRYLRSTYLHAFVGGLSATRFKERLGDLFHEGYLDRPSQQWDFADARCMPVVYENGKGSVQALRACGSGLDEEGRRVAGTAHRQFLHALMICEALASIELAARGDTRLRFISWPEILARAPEAVRASGKSLRLPVPSGGYVVPDGVFGIEYRSSGSSSYRFFALEADRGTMPIARTNARQSSYLGKLAAYREIIVRHVHKTHWGIPNLLVLTLTTSAARCSEIVAKLGAGGSPAFLFKVADGKTLATPAPDLLSEPWTRAGAPPLSIAESC